MTTFTSNIPDAGHTLANDQPLMKDNFTYLKSDIGVDHNATGTTGGTDGYHTTVHFVKRGGDPSTIVDVGQLYTKTVGSDVQLFWLSGAGTPEQLSASAGGGGGAGYVYLTAGIILQFGKITGAPIANGAAVTFPLVGGFPTNVFSITLGPQSNSTNDKTISISTGSVGLTGFTVKCSGSSSFQTLYWMAIGN